MQAKGNQGDYSSTENNCGDPHWKDVCRKETRDWYWRQPAPGFNWQYADRFRFRYANQFLSCDDAGDGHERSMGTVTRMILFVGSALAVLVGVWAMFAAHASMSRFEWKEMDWNRDGATSLS